MNNSTIETLIPKPENRVEYHVKCLVLDAFVKNGLTSFTIPERVIEMFFGEEPDEITQVVRNQHANVMDVFKTPDQVRSWQGYTQALSEANPLAVILKLQGERAEWLN